METIAFKRHDSDTATGSATKPNTMHTMQAKSAKTRRKFPWWIVVVIVLVVAVAGLVILRFSHAAEQGTAPLTASQLKAYVSSQLVAQDQATVTQPIDVTNYTEFQFGGKITPVPAYVSYYVDDVPVAKITTKPFSFVWDSSRYTNGIHTLTAVAFDSNDQPLGATQRVITIDNSQSALQKAKNIVTYPWYWLLQL
jgi:hypothetical protein